MTNADAVVLLKDEEAPYDLRIFYSSYSISYYFIIMHDVSIQLWSIHCDIF